MSIRSASHVSSMPLEKEFEQLFREHSQMLYRSAYSLLGNTADSEDVLQTIFLRLLRSGLPPDLHKNAKGYLYRAAVNLSLDTIRLKHRHKLIDDLHGAGAPADNGGADSNSVEATHRRLAKALAELHPEAAQILILKYAHSYSDADIASVLGVSRGAIAMRLLRSRSRLKRQIAP